MTQVQVPWKGAGPEAMSWHVDISSYKAYSVQRKRVVPPPKNKVNKLKILTPIYGLPPPPLFLKTQLLCSIKLHGARLVKQFGGWI